VSIEEVDRMDGSNSDGYTTTRRSLQAIAEHVLSAALYRATEHIGLRQTPGGFGTPPYPSGGVERRLLVDGTELVVADDGVDRRTSILGAATLRELAAFAAVEPGAPSNVYTAATPLDLDRPLAIEADAARRLADWYALSAQALDRWCDQRAAEQPAVVQLWPEHFDLATTIGTVNYGGSPGDDDHVEPYLYVGPHERPTSDDPFWNEPFGASRSSGEVADADAALGFFRQGAARAAER
jgi:hypothetical protein